MIAKFFFTCFNIIGCDCMQISPISGINFERRLKRREEAEYSDVLNQGRNVCIGENSIGKKNILIVPASSLPNKTGVGSLDSPQSRDFFDFARKYWGIDEIQILPVGQYPEYKGQYPFYSGTSLDLGSQVINIDKYVPKEDFDEIVKQNAVKDRVNFSNVVGRNSAQEKVLKKLFESGKYQNELEAFKLENRQRLEPKALYQALGELNNSFDYKNWNDTDKNLYDRSVVSKKEFNARLEEVKKLKNSEMDFYYFKQYLAEDSLKKAHQELNKKGLKLDGDMLCGFSRDEVWAHPKAFIPDTQIGWSLPALDLHSKEGQELLREKVRFFAQRYDGIRIDASWTYANQPQINDGKLIKRVDYEDKILKIIDDEFKKVKGSNYDSKNIMHEFAANIDDFNIFNGFELKPYLKDRVKIYTSDYLSDDWGTNKSFLERGWDKNGFILGARNHDSGKIQVSDVQVKTLSEILKIPPEKLENPKEFTKAKLAEPMSAKYNMIYFADALNINKQFQGNSDKTLNYTTLIPLDYQDKYFSSLTNGEGYNPMDALEKSFKAKGLDKTEPELYKKIVKYRNILEKPETITGKLAKIGLSIAAAGLMLYGCLKCHKKSSLKNSYL